MIFHGHLVHPDIWMLWFSFFVAVVVACNWAINVVEAILGRRF
jgi:hypothetical protein